MLMGTLSKLYFSYNHFHIVSCTDIFICTMNGPNVETVFYPFHSSTNFNTNPDPTSAFPFASLQISMGWK